MQFGQKNTIRQVWYSWPAIILLLLLCVLLLRSVYARFVAERHMASEQAAAVSEQTRLENHKRELEKQVRYMTGKRGVEEEIRRNFDVARKGEQVVILTGDVPVAATTTATTTPTHPWWQFWR